MRTYGAIALNRKEGVWLIRVEPHVSMRLKRVFKKLERSRMACHVVSDTLEHCADLDWFLDRYPVEISPEDLEHLRARAGAYEERSALVDGLISRRVPPRELALAVPLREYQRIAATLLLESGSLLLADELGLGKSASAIGTFVDPRTLPALVVTLTHLPRQWQAEVFRFAPKLRTHIIDGTKPYDLTLGRAPRACEHRHRFVDDATAQGGARCARCTLTLEDWRAGLKQAPLPDVIISNYHKLASWADTLAPIVRSVVFDECQELRSGRGVNQADAIPAKYLAAERIAHGCDFRLGLSATPIFNYGAEWYSVANVIRPNELGDWPEFRDEWCVAAGEKQTIKDPRAFGTYIRESGIMLRRTREDVGRELPAVSRIPHLVDSNTDALDAVSDACAELARTILKQGESHRGETMLASAEFNNRLRQATGIAKAPYVAEFVRMIVESGEKVVLFAWHREVYSVLLDRLKDLRPALYTGSESVKQKAEARTRFLENGPDGTPLLIMSLRSGAGLDGLQNVCSTVVFGELDWSPGVHAQCVGRVHRDGQQRPVVAYYLISEEGADPIMADVLQLKKAQLDEAIDPNAELVEQLEVDPNHIRKLAADYLAGRARGAAE